MKSVSLRNLVLLIIVMLWGASAETVRNISLVRKVRLEDVCGVGFDAVEKVLICWDEEFGDGRHAIATISDWDVFRDTEASQAARDR